MAKCGYESMQGQYKEQINGLKN